MLVLGVDPGSIHTGYGLVEKDNNNLKFIHAGTINSSGKIPFYERIHKIYRSMVEIIRQYEPQEVAIEDLFFAKNAKSTLKLGHARGAALIAAVECGTKIFEYTPLEIKKSVVGYGRASKDQVRDMVKVILKLKKTFGPDSSDAMAAAICHLNWIRYEKR